MTRAEMDSRESEVSTSSSLGDVDNKVVSELRERQYMDLENLTLTTQPFKTLHLFSYAVLLYLKRSVLYVLKRAGLLVILGGFIVAAGFFLFAVDGPHDKHVQELLEYSRFGLWWIALGVASSIGLGSGLHTFVMYLGPHIAFFTIKAMKCGRVDLKTSPYDTIQLNRVPSWLAKECSSYGPPVFPSIPNSMLRVPLTSILPQVQLEAILWGVGTALGELPPYFISRAASMSGKVDGLGELDTTSSEEDGYISIFMRQFKSWLLSHSQYLNFFVILLLASVPNPLFDLAGIMCGQLGISFWTFFLATLTGKAIIKTHIQTVFIIMLCNNQLLEWLENELIWVLGHIPVVSKALPKIISGLRIAKEKYLLTPASDLFNAQDKKWGLSFNLVWNSVVWLTIINFFVKIVNSTAQRQLKKQQDIELSSKIAALGTSVASDGVASKN